MNRLLTPSHEPALPPRLLRSRTTCVNSNSRTAHYDLHPRSPRPSLCLSRSRVTLFSPAMTGLPSTDTLRSFYFHICGICSGLLRSQLNLRFALLACLDHGALSCRNIGTLHLKGMGWDKRWSCWHIKALMVIEKTVGHAG